MEVIKGKRVVIKKLTQEDVFGMQKWGKHTEPLYYNYNFPELKYEEAKEWFKIKTQRNNKKCFGIFNEEKRIIGYLSIKNIKRLRKSSTLGIVFDPNYINKGYGTEAISLFLEYYFDELKMKTLYLEVDKYNNRAISCYIKCGFKKIQQSNEKLQLLDGGYSSIGDDADSNYFYIDKKRKRIYSYLYRMKITKDVYLENQRHESYN